MRMLIPSTLATFFIFAVGASAGTPGGENTSVTSQLEAIKLKSESRNLPPTKDNSAEIEDRRLGRIVCRGEEYDVINPLYRGERYEMIHPIYRGEKYHILPAGGQKSPAGETNGIEGQSAENGPVVLSKEKDEKEPASVTYKGGSAPNEGGAENETGKDKN